MESECQSRERESRDLRRDLEEIRMAESLIHLDITRRESMIEMRSAVVQHLENQKKHIENVIKFIVIIQLLIHLSIYSTHRFDVCEGNPNTIRRIRKSNGVTSTRKSLFKGTQPADVGDNKSKSHRS